MIGDYDSDDASDNPSDHSHDDDSASYDQLIDVIKEYTSIIRKTNEKVDKLKLEKKSMVASSQELETKCSEMKLENDKLVAKHDALNAKFQDLTTSYANIEQIFDALSNEKHDKAKVEVIEKVMVDCAIKCDELVVNPPMDNRQEANPPSAKASKLTVNLPMPS